MEMKSSREISDYWRAPSFSPEPWGFTLESVDTRDVAWPFWGAANFMVSWAYLAAVIRFLRGDVRLQAEIKRYCGIRLGGKGDRRCTEGFEGSTRGFEAIF